MGEFHCNKNRVKWSSKINLFISSCFLIQPLLILTLYSMGINISLFNGSFVIKPWRVFLFTCSIIPLICFLMLLNLPESPKFLLIQGKDKETLSVLQEMHRVNHRKNTNKRVNMNMKSFIYSFMSFYFNPTQYPVNNILPEGTETFHIRSTAAKTFVQYLCLLWQQTKILFSSPHLLDITLLCAVTLFIYMGGQGLLLWYNYKFDLFQKYSNCCQPL